MDKLRVLLPKGRLFNSVLQLFRDAGYLIHPSDRNYRPAIECDWIDLKIIKPKNIGDLLGLGSHDAGFTGLDWVTETGADVEKILNLGFDEVSIIAAAPSKLDETALMSKELIVATEYVRLAGEWLKKTRYKYKPPIRTYGATEVFPDDDADIIIDNVSTGQTLKDNGLYIIDTIMKSSTCFFASKEAMGDKEKREKIEKLKTLFEAALEGREYVMLEMNVDKKYFDNVINFVKTECMRSPTIAPLYDNMGYAIKIAIPKKDVPWVLVGLKTQGATDILEFALNKVIR